MAVPTLAAFVNRYHDRLSDVDDAIIHVLANSSIFARNPALVDAFKQDLNQELARGLEPAEAVSNAMNYIGGTRDNGHSTNDFDSFAGRGIGGYNSSGTVGDTDPDNNGNFGPTGPSATPSVDLGREDVEAAISAIDDGGANAESSDPKPILIDLDGDGVEILTQDESFVLFDWDDDGFSERTGWVGADDGFLMFDENNDGQITTGREVAFAQ